MTFNSTSTGIQNEYDFAIIINKKRVKDLNILLRNFIDDIFGQTNEDDVVKCKVDCKKKKYDIVICINDIEKKISIKKGIKNSVHMEEISSFIHFLIENNVSRNTIIEYLKYQYADGTTNGTGKIRLSANEYKKENQNKIDKINQELNKKELLEKAIDRFVLKGNKSDESIDALIYGVPNDFIWIKACDIKKVILSKQNHYSTAVHFGPLTVQPQDRCLNRNIKYESRRFCVQVKWYNIADDIIEFMNEVTMKSSGFVE